MLGNCIKSACKIAGVSLKKGCEISGVKYGTLFNQIDKGREIPFSTVERISKGLRIPISFFASDPPQSKRSSTTRTFKNIAEEVNAERALDTRAGFAVTTDHILDWFHQEGGQLRNWEWFADQVDLYHPTEPTDDLMRPIRMGHRSLTTERLMINGERDFHRVVSKFARDTLDRAMWSHQTLEHTPYVVSDESLDVIVKGQRVRGGYRKVSMRLTDPLGEPINAIFSKLTWLHSPQNVGEIGGVDC